jgi:glycosyltransferase involved in cell wall biosynthesis
MPNAILEALAAGRPVVATRTGGVPELLTQGVTGVVVEPGDVAGMADALERVLTDSVLVQRLCEAGPALIAERFPWARTVEGHEQLYSSLAQRS